MRELQLPLKTVKQLLACDPADAAKRVAEHWRDAEAAHDARRKLADYLVDRLSGKMPAMYEVATREIPERSLLCLKRNVSEKGQFAFGKEFIAIWRERPLTTMEGRAGASFCIYWSHPSADGDGLIEWCMPVPAGGGACPRGALSRADVANRAGATGDVRRAADRVRGGAVEPRSASHWMPGGRSRRCSTRVSVLPSRRKTSACAPPISLPPVTRAGVPDDYIDLAIPFAVAP